MNNKIIFNNHDSNLIAENSNCQEMRQDYDWVVTNHDESTNKYTFKLVNIHTGEEVPHSKKNGMYIANANIWNKPKAKFAPKKPVSNLLDMLCKRLKQKDF